MKRYNHAFAVGVQIVSPEADAGRIPVQNLIKALENTLAYLKTEEEGVIRDSFELDHTFEVDAAVGDEGTCPSPECLDSSSKADGTDTPADDVTAAARTTERILTEGDYVVESSVWMTVGTGSVKIKKDDDGISVAIYPLGHEDVDAITETWITWDELEFEDEDDQDESA